MQMNESLFLNFGKSLDESAEDVREFIRTGSTLGDLALGGGFAKGRIINTIGDESSGKTLLALSAARKFQIKYKDGFVIYDDAEAALETNWAKRVFKLESDRFRYLDIDHCSSTVEDFEYNVGLACDVSIKEGAPIFYILDSLDATKTERTKEGGTKKADKKEDEEIESDKVKKESMRDKLDKPAVMSGLLNRLNQKIKKAELTLNIISQTRAKIGVMFGEKTDITGGKALKFYSVQRIKLAEIRQVKDSTKKRTLGIDIKLKVIKNKVAPPFREALFPIYFDSGIADVESCIDFLTEHNIISKSDSGRKYNFKEKEYSRDNIEEYFSEMENYKMMRRLVKEEWKRYYND